MNEAWDYLENRFGITRDELNGALKMYSGDYWLIRETDKELDFDNNGVRFIRVTGIGLKPTTYALQLLGDRISRNRVKVNREELKKLLKREEMIKTTHLEQEGYVAVVYENQVIGCGMFKDGKTSSRIPKHRSKHLLKILNQ